MRTNDYDLRIVDSNGEVVVLHRRVKWCVVRNSIDMLENHELSDQLIESPGFGMWKNPVFKHGYRRDWLIEWVRYER